MSGEERRSTVCRSEARSSLVKSITQCAALFRLFTCPLHFGVLLELRSTPNCNTESALNRACQHRFAASNAFGIQNKKKVIQYKRKQNKWSAGLFGLHTENVSLGHQFQVVQSTMNGRCGRSSNNVISRRLVMKSAPVTD